MPVTVVFVEFVRRGVRHNAPMRGPASNREPSVARQILVLQVLVVVVLVVASLGLAAYDARRDARASATDHAVAVARSVADSPTVVDALDDPDPSAVLQPFAERVRHDTAVDFVVVMRLDRTRFTHPDPARIGEHFIGDLGSAPDGKVFTEEHTGTLGPSMRAVVPVLDGDRVVALVSVGITVAAIDKQLRQDLVLILLSALAVLAAGLGGAWLVSRRLRRQTHGMGEREITRMYEYYSAVLHAVREGLLLVDDAGRVQLVNDEARRLLRLPDDVAGRSVHDLGLPPGLVAAALGRTAESDDIYVAGEHVLVVSSAPATWQGREVGAVVTLRDHTELQSVTGELDVVRALTESLRSQNHEAANRLHTVVSLIEMGRPEEAIEFATEELQVAQLLTDRVVGAVGDPVVAALLLGKTAQAAERGIELTIAGDLPAERPQVASRDLVTVLGNLVDNALDAVAGRQVRRVAVELGGEGGVATIVVGDSGPGLTDEEAGRVLQRGWTTKASAADVAGRGVGLALVGQVARRYAGEVRIGSSPLGGAEFTVTLHPLDVGAGAGAP
jgi:two-component system, CitB family, sensor kinase